MHSSHQSPRSKFYSLKKAAEKYDTLKIDGLALKNYLAALDEQTHIIHRLVDDERNAAEVCRFIAIIYFNKKDHTKAAEYYKNATLYINSIEYYESLLDSDYRKLIKNYVDLSDAYRRVNRFDDADKEFSEAIKFLHLIRYHTDEEKAAIQAAKNGDEYRLFRKTVEDKTCKKSYLESDVYKTNQEKFFDKRDENSLISGLNTITFLSTPKQAGASNPTNPFNSIPFQAPTQQQNNPFSFGSSAFGMFGTQQQQPSTTHPLWGQRQQVNNTQNDDPEAGMRMDFC